MPSYAIARLDFSVVLLFPHDEVCILCARTSKPETLEEQAVSDDSALYVDGHITCVGSGGRRTLSHLNAVKPLRNA